MRVRHATSGTLPNIVKPLGNTKESKNKGNQQGFKSCRATLPDSVAGNNKILINLFGTDREAKNNGKKRREQMLSIPVCTTSDIAHMRFSKWHQTIRDAHSLESNLARLLGLTVLLVWLKLQDNIGRTCIQPRLIPYRSARILL